VPRHQRLERQLIAPACVAVEQLRLGKPADAPPLEECNGSA
jgi:hypothetical protein